MPTNNALGFTERASEAELIEVEKIIDELEAHCDCWSKDAHEQAFKFHSQKTKLRKITRGKLKGASVLTDPKKMTLKAGPWKGVTVTSKEGQDIHFELELIARRRKSIETLRKLLAAARERQ